MTARPPKEAYGIDMPFGEALERFIGVDPKEMHANIAKSKQKKPPGGKKKRKPPSGKATQSVVSLRERKTSLRRRGLA